MSTRHEPAALASLGLPGLATAPDVVQLAWAEPDDSHALGAGGAALAFSALAAMGFVGEPFSEVRDSALGRLHMAVSSPAQRVLRVSAPAGVPLHVRVPDGHDASHLTYVPDEDPGTAYLDMSMSLAMIVRAGSDIVLVDSDAAGLRATPLMPSSLALSALTSLPDVTSWCGDAADPWLVEQVQPLAASPEAWSRVVAAGMLARLLTPADGAQARAWLAALREGAVDAALAGPRRWVRSLGDADAQAILDVVVSECASLTLDIEDVVDDVHAAREGWDDAAREVAYRRDDLEGVLVLLDARGADAPVRAALAAVDRAGTWLQAALPADWASGDERLRRAALKVPGAWWGRAG